VEHIFQKYKIAISCVVFVVLLIFGCNQILVREEAHASSNNETTQDWDRLLVEEIPSLRNNIDAIQNAVKEGNYSLVREQIDDIESGDNWYNIQKELETRDAVDLIFQFKTSLSEVDTMAEAEDSIAIARKTQILSDDFDEIVRELGKPVVDIQRLIMTTSIIGIVIGSGLYIIPKLRSRYNIKY
jgi:hypothetical protein